MSRTITVNGTDRTALIRLDSTVWVEAANRGQVGLGGYVMDDTSLLDVPAHKVMTVVESSASPTRLHTGYIGERSISRGPFSIGSERQWDVMVTDLNVLLDDFLLNVPSGNRPAETDVARVNWLLNQRALTEYSITAGQVPSTNTVMLDKSDHRSSHPRDVLDECSQASGKNFFLYNYGAGNKLYYDLATSTSATTTSALRISSVAADVDSAVTFAPLGEPRLHKDPLDIYSTVRFVYSSGAVTVNRLATETTFRHRTINVTGTRVRAPARAREKANKYLTAAATETTSIDGLEIMVAAQYVNDIRAGHRLEIKIPHLGYAAFTYARVLRREVRPAVGPSGVSDVVYRVRLDVADDVKPTTFSTARRK